MVYVYLQGKNIDKDAESIMSVYNHDTGLFEFFLLSIVQFDYFIFYSIVHFAVFI